MAGLPAHFIGYYVLVMGLQNRPWNDCKGAEKAALRAKNSMRSRPASKALLEKGRSDLEAPALNLIGVIANPEKAR